MPRLAAAATAAVVAILVGARTAAAVEPRFVDGDVASLRCRVVKASAIHAEKPSSIVQVAVKNEGAASAEPLVFEFLDAGGTSLGRVERVPEPLERRAGRAVPPKGETTYALLAPLPPKAARSGTRVAVATASFFEGPAPEKPAITVSRPRVENAEYTAVLGRHLRCSIVEVDNRSPRVVDLVFRARFDQPKGVESLLAYRAPAGKSIWVIEDAPMGASMGSWGEPEVTNLDWVDWCEVHGPLDAAPLATASLEVELRVAPAGDLAPRLRDVWEAPYRYSAKPVSLSGRFRLENPGTDAMWRGVKRLEGTFVLNGFSGGRWTAHEIAFDAKSVPAALANDLAAVVEDRFRMWFPRDPASRPTFEDAFDGATISGTAERLEIDSGAIRRIDARDDLPARLALHDAGGVERERRIEWTRAFGATVARSIRTGDETLTATWLDAGGGYVLPGRIELAGVFPDWGPETLELSKWEVR